MEQTNYDELTAATIREIARNLREMLTAEELAELLRLLSQEEES